MANIVLSFISLFALSLGIYIGSRIERARIRRYQLRKWYGIPRQK